MGYDVKCYELAETFIDDERGVVKTEKMVAELAQLIQDTIEEFIEYDARMG